MMRTVSCLSLQAMPMDFDPEDQELIDVARCEEGQREGSAAATFASPGPGFFTWNDDWHAQQSLAQMRGIRIIVAEGGRQKHGRH